RSVWRGRADVSAAVSEGCDPPCQAGRRPGVRHLPDPPGPVTPRRPDRAAPRPATGSLRCKGGVPMIRAVITTYGTLHGPAPADGDALLIDLSEALRNPHANPDMRYRTGLDPEVRAHVLETPGADRIVAL